MIIFFALLAFGLLGYSWHSGHSGHLAFAYGALGSAVLCAIFIFQAYQEFRYTQLMIKKFDNYENIWCVDGTFALKLASLNRSDGWNRDGDKITNGQVTLFIRQCKENI